MVDRNKKSKICDKGWEEEDRISQLPNHLISDNILTHLSTKDAVRTSVLSTKWRNHWQSVPVLNLDSRKFTNLDAFVNFGDKFFNSHWESWILKLRLRIQDPSIATSTYLSSWIDAVTKCKVQKLSFGTVRLNYANDHLSVIPMSIYTCETLVKLRLYHVTMVDAEFVSLPCLKVMDLHFVRGLSEATIEKLMLGSPVLEDLTIIRYGKANASVVTQIRSQTIKRIYIDAVTKIVIDAPLLQYLKTHVLKNNNFKIVSSGLPAKLDIQVFFRRFITDLVSEILNDMSKVRDLVICCKISKVYVNI